MFGANLKATNSSFWTAFVHMADPKSGFQIHGSDCAGAKSGPRFCCSYATKSGFPD